jgi:hypothetical protein
MWARRVNDLDRCLGVKITISDGVLKCSLAEEDYVHLGMAFLNTFKHVGAGISIDVSSRVVLVLTQ